MSELANPVAAGAGVVAILLLIALLSEHEVLRLARSAVTQRHNRALLVVIIPMLLASALIAVLRVSQIAGRHR